MLGDVTYQAELAENSVWIGITVSTIPKNRRGQSGNNALGFTSPIDAQTVSFSDAGKWQNDPLQELLKRRHVHYSCFDQVVESTNHYMTFDDFGCLHNSLCKTVEDVRRGVVEPYLDKDECAASDFGRLEHGPNSANSPALRGNDVSFS